MCGMKLKIGVILALWMIAGWGNTGSADAQRINPIKIGIIVPIEHLALQKIVNSFKNTVETAFPQAVTFDVRVSQLDLKLANAIIDVFMSQNVDIIVPIGTVTTKMTLGKVKNKPIICLAARYLESERKKRSRSNITGVIDHMMSRQQLDFIKAIFPDIQKISVIYDLGNEKLFAEIEELVNYGKQLGIQFQVLGIQHLLDINQVGGGIAPDTNALFILKDNLLASGIQLLIPVAKRYNIPLITSDEGTVSEGATLAFGYREEISGQLGGEIAVKILQGTPIQDIEMQTINKFSIFYNPTVCSGLHIIPVLQQYANKNHYELINIQNIQEKNPL